MSFDPDDPLLTKADHDAYVRWCAEQLVAVADESPDVTPHIYGTAMKAAAWLWVVAQAQMHLDDDVEDQREQHQQNLGGLFTRAREVERAKGDVRFKNLLGARIALDCFQPVGRYGGTLLEAAKLAIEALVLVFVYPPIDKWDLPAPASWALVLCGAVLLEEITEPLSFSDYSVRPSPGMIGKITWDAANRASFAAGAHFPSPN